MQTVNIIEQQQQEKTIERSSSSFSGDEKHDDEKASDGLSPSEKEAKQTTDGIAFEEGEREAELQPAVAKVEALYRVFGKGRGKSSIWILTFRSLVNSPSLFESATAVLTISSQSMVCLLTLLCLRPLPKWPRTVFPSTDLSLRRSSPWLPRLSRNTLHWGPS